MVMVMAPDATDEDIAAVVARVEARRRRGVRRQGRGPHDHRPGRRHRLLPPPEPAHPARASPTCTASPTPTSWSAASTIATGRRSGSGRGRPGADRPGDVHVHRRPVRGREPPTQTLEAAQMAKAAGATLLRGGAFKPRTSPYAFQGLGVEALEILADVARGDRAARRHRGRRRPRRRGRRRARRHAADRHPQHGQLRAAPGGRRVRASRCCSSAA